MSVFVITWSYSDHSAFGLVGVYDPALGKEILALLEEHSGTKQFTGEEVEIVERGTAAPPPAGLDQHDMSGIAEFMARDYDAGSLGIVTTFSITEGNRSVTVAYEKAPPGADCKEYVVRVEGEDDGDAYQSHVLRSICVPQVRASLGRKTVRVVEVGP